MMLLVKVKSHHSKVITPLANGYLLRIPHIDPADIAVAALASEEAQFRLYNGVLLEAQTGLALPKFHCALDELLGGGVWN
jgi:hypothetical protein